MQVSVSDLEELEDLAALGLLCPHLSSIYLVIRKLTEMKNTSTTVPLHSASPLH